MIFDVTEISHLFIKIPTENSTESSRRKRKNSHLCHISLFY